MGEIKRCQMLIDGEWVSASDGAVFPSVSPVTGAVWAEVPEATAADVDRAVRAADRALSGEWGRMTPSARGKCLRKLGDLLAEASEALGRAGGCAGPWGAIRSGRWRGAGRWAGRSNMPCGTCRK